MLATTGLLAVAACGGEQASTTPTATSPLRAPTSAPTAISSSVLPTTAPATTSPPVTPDSSESTRPAQTTPPSEAGTIPPSPPSTFAEVAAAIDAHAATLFGLHLFAFRPSDDVVTVVSDRLGPPTSDTGDLPTPEEFACTGSSTYRVVRWGDLRMTFVSGVADGARPAPPADTSDRMLAWSVGDDLAAALAPVDQAPTDPTPTGITTVEGIGVGSTRDDLRTAFDDEGVLNGFDGDRVAVAPDMSSGAPSATSILLAGDTVIGIGAGPLDCLDPDEER